MFRVVALEVGEFVDGKVGLVPRRNLIRAALLICPVLFIGKRRTSKVCHVCECDLKRSSKNRDLVCDHCERDIERDTNATLNIAKCAIRRIHGLERPHAYATHPDTVPKNSTTTVM